MPKTKKPESSSDSDSGPDERKPQPAKKKSKDSGSGSGDNKDGAPNQWTLEKLRQVRINEFHGRTMIDIREFYEKDGEQLPGKKGISLTRTQWNKLLEIAPEVNKAIGE